MLSKICLNFNYRFHGSYQCLKVINISRICGIKTKISNTSHHTSKKLSEADLTPIDSEDSEVRVGNIIHKSRLNRVFRPHDNEFYLRLINKAAYDGDLEKLLSVFFHDIILVDRYRPNAFIVNVLLKHLANLGGHSEASFKVVKKSLDINMELSDVTYSLLFKNCAKEIGNNDILFQISNKIVQLVSNEELEKIRQPAVRALQFVEQMKSKGIKMGATSLNSLILTLNKAGMINDGLRVLDEFLNEGYKPTAYTLSAVLEGCLFDRKKGFGLAMLLFNRLVYHRKCNVDQCVFNTLLKVTKYCQFGNHEIILRVIDSSNGFNESFKTLCETNTESTELTPISNSIHRCPEGHKEIALESAKMYNLPAEEFINKNWSLSNNFVNYLNSPTNMITEKFNNIFDIQWLESNLTPGDKLACLGGIFGFISAMERFQCKPNMFILTSLISCLPYNSIFTNDSQQNDFYLSAVKQISKYYQLKENESFKNAIMKRTIQSGIQNTDEIIDVSHFSPYSWSSYSKKCKTSEDVKKFFYMLHKNQVVPSSQIIYSILRSVVTWGARLNILHKMKELEIEFDRSIVVFIEDEINKYRKKLATMDTDELDTKVTGPFYRFQKFYAHMLDCSKIESITTGDRKIRIKDVPNRFIER